MLWIKQEIVWQIGGIIEIYFDIRQRIITHIMVADRQDQGNQSIHSVIEFFKQFVHIVPAVEASIHAIIIGVIAAYQYHIWIVCCQVRDQFTSIFFNADISTYNESYLIGILTG